MTTAREVWAAKSARRNTAVLNAACSVALCWGLHKMTRANVAAAAEVANGSVNLAFGTMAALRDEVVRQSIARPILPVLAQAVALGHPLALAAPEDIRRAALEAVS